MSELKYDKTPQESQRESMKAAWKRGCYDNVNWIEQNSGKNNGMYGKHHSNEAKLKISLAKKGKNHPNYGKRGEGTPMYGKKHTAATKKRMSESHKIENLSTKTRRKLSESHSGKNRHMYGKQHTEETKQKIRETRLKRVFPTKDTSIEVALQEELDKRKIVYEKHIPVCDICQPDIVFPSFKLAVFADGDYWHSKKFQDGKAWQRDRYQDKALRENGWTPLRFWGSEIRDNVLKCVDNIVSVLEL